MSSVPANDTPTIGSEIRRLRDAMGLTLVDFGALVNIPWQTIAAYEAERAQPPAMRLLAILHATRGVNPPFRVGRLAKAAAREVSAAVEREAA